VDVGLGYWTVHVIRNEGDVWIAIAFENVLVHSLVARLASAVAALGIDNDLSGTFAGRDIIVNGSALQLKRTVDSMKNVTQRELDARLGRVQFEHLLLPK